MTTPIFDIGQVVYLKESAALGFLEPVRINGIHKHNDGWLYSIRNNVSQPSAVSQYGDRLAMNSGQTLFFSEDEFVLVCDALALAEANALAVLSKLQAQRASLCPTEITSGTT